MENFMKVSHSLNKLLEEGPPRRFESNVERTESIDKFIDHIYSSLAVYLLSS